MLENYFPVELKLLNLQKGKMNPEYMYNLFRGNDWDEKMLSLDLEEVNTKTKEMVIDQFLLNRSSITGCYSFSSPHLLILPFISSLTIFIERRKQL